MIKLKEFIMSFNKIVLVIIVFGVLFFSIVFVVDFYGYVCLGIGWILGGGE